MASSFCFCLSACRCANLETAASGPRDGLALFRVVSGRMFPSYASGGLICPRSGGAETLRLGCVRLFERLRESFSISAGLKFSTSWAASILRARLSPSAFLASVARARRASMFVNTALGTVCLQHCSNYWPTDRP